MADKIVTIEYDPEAGTMSVDTENFHGQGCKTIHEAFRVMGTVTKEVVKPAFHERQPNQNVLRTGR